MAYTQTDLDNLDAAIGSGARVVMVEGARVEYRSLEEMMQARQRIARLIAGTASSKRFTLAKTARGL